MSAGKSSKCAVSRAQYEKAIMTDDISSASIFMKRGRALHNMNGRVRSSIMALGAFGVLS